MNKHRGSLSSKHFVLGIMTATFLLASTVSLTTVGMPKAAMALPLIPCAGATIIGTANNDNLVGTPGADIIDGLAGDDTIAGLGGDDLICGGDGIDTISAGSGNDGVIAGAGNDQVDGAAGLMLLMGPKAMTL